MESLIQQKSQEFVIEVNDDVPNSLYFDKQRLTQILINLLSNANKFTASGGKIEMYVKLLEEDQDNVKIEFVVKDNGIGIKDTHIDKLFISFEQIKYEDIDETSGTGLGLAITKNLIEMMSGEIEVTSKVRKGSTFTFYIVIQKGKDTSLEKKSMSETINYENHQIMLAEDIEINREIVMALLEPTNIKLVLARNGKEAVDLFYENPHDYDLIFMDIQMPEMNGHDATKHIRKHDSDKAKEIPIIAMTANAFKEDIEKCIEAGMNDHIGKPIDFEMVMQLLHKYLGKKK